jgi:MoxR-like ATPase
MHGLSPRAGLGLLRAAKAWALLSDRDYVIPEDIQAVLPACVVHRLAASEYGGRLDEEAVVSVILDQVALA